MCNSYPNVSVCQNQSLKALGNDGGATGWKSLRAEAVEYFGTDTVEEVCKKTKQGTAAQAKDRLKMSVKTSASCSMKTLTGCSAQGPAAFHAFNLLRVEQASEVESMTGISSGVNSTLELRENAVLGSLFHGHVSIT